MSTVRAYSNNKRISTGRVMKNGSFFQAYPAHRVFETQDEWMNHWKTNAAATFAINGEVIAAPSSANETVTVTVKTTTTTITRKPQGDMPPPASSPKPSTPPTNPTPTNPPPAPRKTKNKKNEENIDETLEGWTFQPKQKFVAPAGTYYIGDICYFVDDKLYDRIFGGHEYESGLYTRKSDGAFFMLDNTAYGDGCYNGSDGFEYGVDAGIIGIASRNLGPKNDENVYGGKLHTFKDPVEIKFGGGVFRFKSHWQYVVIDTDGSKYNSDEDW
jgi:hypothetical protein